MVSLQPISATSAYLLLPSAICSNWHRFPCSTRPDCNWTKKFRSQQTSHMEPSAASTMVTGPVGEHFQAGNADASVLDRPVPLRPFMILVPDINIPTYLLNCMKWYLIYQRNQSLIHCHHYQCVNLHFLVIVAIISIT